MFFKTSQKYYLVSSLTSSTFFSTFLAGVFLTGAFLAGTFLAESFFSTFSSFLFSSFLFSTFLTSGFGLEGAFCKAFKDKPILLILGSKLIILASTSSHTFIKSLIFFTTP